MALSDVIFRLTIVIWKNLWVWKRRYLTVVLELSTPILVAALLAYVNTDQSVFRTKKLEYVDATRHTSVNQSKDSFYDMGADFTEDTIFQFTLCKKEHSDCYIGYVADDETVDAIFENEVFLNTSAFRNPRIWKSGGGRNMTNGTGTIFARFPNETSVTKCLDDPESCMQLNRDRHKLLSFRGAVVFETGVNDSEIKYKIRLLEKEYNDLRHVLKTNSIGPSLFDKREFVKSYLASGFLSLQYHVERMIVSHLNKTHTYEKIQSLKEKVTLFEMPHRHLDQYHYPDDAAVTIDSSGFDGDQLLTTINDLSEPERAQRSTLGSIALVLCFTFLIPFELRRIVQEKEQGLTGLLMVTGMTHRMQWIGNLFTAILIYILPVTVMVILLTVRFSARIGAVFELVTPFVLWLLFLLYIAAMTSVCSVFSVFFNKPVVAMTATTTILLVSFIAPYYHVELLYNSAPTWIKVMFCGHPSTAFQIALSLLIRYEDLASETNIFTVGNVIPTDTMRLIYIIIILFVESCFFMALAIYLDRVCSTNTGARKPWYYLCQPSQYFERQTRVFPGTLPGPSSTVTQSARPAGPHLSWKTASNVLRVVEGSVNTVAVADGKRRKSVVINAEEPNKPKGEDGKPSTNTTPSASNAPSLRGYNPAAELQNRPPLPPRLPPPPVTPVGFEPHLADDEPSVVTFNLTKKYGKSVAVKDLNIKLFHGEIFALLGHNGAGKSTTLNLFSGYVTPTSGSAKICGYNLKTHTVRIQSFTGMCPQTSALFDDLTPFEHLLIFGRLRGLRGGDAKEEANDLIEKLNLVESSSLLARNLSKGDSRKLSLAVALIGNPKVVILDEPTGGMDYYSRRAVWDLLLKIRANHTIIFSTHFMDEAELLGDKIGIMVNGKMEVMGSHHFLRYYLRVGYSLKMTVDPHMKPDPQAVLRLVQRTMPNAKLTTLRTNPNADHVCNVNLPDDGYSANAMSALFTDLAEKKESLGIVGFSVSHASVDELFLALMRKLNPNDDDLNQVEETHDVLKRGHHKPSFCRQFGVLLKKRAYFSIRKKTLLFVQIVMPITSMCLALMRLYSSIEVDGRKGPPLRLSLDSYPNPITYVYPSGNFRNDTLRSVFGNSTTIAAMADIAGNFIRASYATHRQRHVLAMRPDTEDDEKVIMYFSPYFIHTAPLALNAYFNIQMKRLDPNKSIAITNHPLSHPYFTGPYFGDDPQAIDIYASLCTVAFTLMLALCIVFPMEERISQMKHLQLMAGISPFSYWTVILICDFLSMIGGMLAIAIFTRLYPPANAVNSFPEDRTTEVRILIFVAQGYCSCAMMHLFSHFAHSLPGGFSLFLSISILFGMLIPYFTVSTIHGISLLGTKDISWYLRINPFHGTSVIIRKLASTLLQNGKCNYFTSVGEKYYCNVSLTEEEVREHYKVSCCRNCYEIPGATDCYDRFEIIGTPWSTRNYSYRDFIDEDPSPIHNLNSIASHSIFYEVVFSFAMGIVFQFFTMFLDTDFYRYLKACVFGMRGRAFQTDVEDDDVNAEMDRVEEMVETGELSEDMLVAHNLCKTYGIFPVVHNVNFGVHPGECFGILGVNGAGKSTLFKLLTGTSVETFGNVYSGDCSLTYGRKRFMMKMGYLPHQGKVSIGYMTPLEHLYLFCALRGQSEEDSEKDIEHLLKKLRIEKYKNTQMMSLSGGIQRRVCTALALVAQPPIILLDEPTSSSDPVARMYFWEVVKDAKKAGQTVIFNSHRIFECEELCDRVGILIDGKFQCIGTPTHLKHKFGIGFKLLIKLVPGHADNQDYVSSLSNTIVEIFYPCSLRDRRRNVIQYVIHDSEISWDYLFQQMEHIHLRYTDLVEDYSFSETTLEEVFLQFVIQQHCGRIRRDFGCICSC